MTNAGGFETDKSRRHREFPSLVRHTNTVHVPPLQRTNVNNRQTTRFSFDSCRGLSSLHSTAGGSPGAASGGTGIAIACH